MAKNEGVCETSAAIVVCLTPDVCFTSGSPVPYQIIAKFSDAIRQVDTVRFTSVNAMNMNSRITRVVGDEPGSDGGIMSGVNVGYCRPITHSSTVRAKGDFVIFHSSLYWMNCAGPDTAGNTRGRAFYVKCANFAGVGAYGEILGDTNPPVEPSDKEKSWYQKFYQGAANLTGEAWEGLEDTAGLVKDLGQVSAAGWTMMGTDLTNKVLGTDYEYPEFVTSDSTQKAADHLEAVGGAIKDQAIAIGDYVGDAAHVSAAGYSMMGTDAVNSLFGTHYEYSDFATDPSVEAAMNRVDEKTAKAWNEIKSGYEKQYAEGGGWQVAGYASAQALKLVAEALITHRIMGVLGGEAATDAKMLETVDEEALRKIRREAEQMEVEKAGVKVTKAGFWKEGPVIRGRLIEEDLAKTEYSGWQHTDELPGYQNSKNYPVVDFVKDNEIVSLKTADTQLSSWPSKLKNDISDLADFTPPDDLVSGDVFKVLDLRVQPGGIEIGGEKLQKLIDYAHDNGIDLHIKEYP